MKNIPKYEKNQKLEIIRRDSAKRSNDRRLSSAIATPGSDFVILGKYVAPGLVGMADRYGDDVLVALALGGHEPEDIAGTVGIPAAELTVRLVELRTGPLGRIRPATGDPVSGPFADVKLRRSRLHIPAKQKPILSLVAQAVGHRLQRLGDRLYLGGEETTLPSLVRLAREQGVRIRYPTLDPMDDAWSTGPSRHDSPAGRHAGGGQ